MHTKHTPEEFIITIPSSKSDACRNFLSALALSDENADILDRWYYESIWTVESDAGEKLIVVFGKEKLHLILKKNEHFAGLQEIAYKFLS